MKKLVIGLFIALGVLASGQGREIANIKREFSGYKEVQKGDVLYLSSKKDKTMAFIGTKDFKIDNLKKLLKDKGFKEEKQGYYKNPQGNIGYLGDEEGVKYLLISEDGIGLADMREKMYVAFENLRGDSMDDVEDESVQVDGDYVGDSTNEATEEEPYEPPTRVKETIVVQNSNNKKVEKTVESKKTAPLTAEDLPKLSLKGKKGTRKHTVVKGDTLYNIGRRSGVSVKELQKINGLRDNNIHLGQIIKY
ncbi:MAG: LysM peptidoglycan-binding domain-containing protein [Cetobacterium sp.]